MCERDRNRNERGARSYICQDNGESSSTLLLGDYSPASMTFAVSFNILDERVVFGLQVLLF